MLNSNKTLKESYSAPEVKVIDIEIQCGIAESPNGLIDEWTPDDPITL